MFQSRISISIPGVGTIKMATLSVAMSILTLPDQGSAELCAAQMRRQFYPGTWASPPPQRLADGVKNLSSKVSAAAADRRLLVDGCWPAFGGCGRQQLHETRLVNRRQKD